jgi:hypothetical protein
MHVFAYSADTNTREGHILTRNQVEFLTRLCINKTENEEQLTVKDIGGCSMF